MSNLIMNEELDTQINEEVVNNEKVVNKEVFLNDIWSIYFHDPISDNWQSDGYIKLNDISTIQDFWTTFSLIKPHLNKGMFFFSREHIFPKWDNEYNKDGSFLSFKVLKEHIEEFSENILISILGENLLKKDFCEKWDHINGISFSPKKNFCIV